IQIGIQLRRQLVGMITQLGTRLPQFRYRWLAHVRHVAWPLRRGQARELEGLAALLAAFHLRRAALRTITTESVGGTMRAISAASASNAWRFSPSYACLS